MARVIVPTVFAFVTLMSVWGVTVAGFEACLCGVGRGPTLQGLHLKGVEYPAANFGIA